MLLVDADVSLLRSSRRPPRTKTAAMLVVGILVGVALPADLPAAEPVPLVIEAIGTGAVRVRLAEGTTAPCDSSLNRRVFDGWVAANAPLTATVGSSCVCVEHTWGGFRESQWSPGRIVCNRPRTRLRAADPVIRVRFSTDAP